MRQLIYFVVVFNWSLRQRLLAALFSIIFTVSFGSGIVNYFYRVVVDFDSCLQSLDRVIIDCVLYLFQLILLFLGVKCVLSESIAFSRCRLTYLRVKFVVSASNDTPSSIAHLLLLVGSCWVYSSVQTIYWSIHFYLCSAILLWLCL